MGVLAMPLPELGWTSMLGSCAFKATASLAGNHSYILADVLVSACVCVCVCVYVCVYKQHLTLFAADLAHACSSSGQLGAGKHPAQGCAASPTWCKQRVPKP